MGATHFIAKPFTPEELAAAVRRALMGKGTV
jgi:DNA-binding response OmpR family regulator